MTQEISTDFLALQTALAGRYSLERELGRGGMGVVYLAHEVALDRPVALKVLPAEASADAGVRARFMQEARTAAKLSHPHIVPIFTVDEVDRYVFFAMALVDGETLGERVRTRGPLSDSAAIRLMREVSWALGYAHAQGVVHRDVKPDNILLEHGTGRALVTDFGIAEVVVAGDAGRERSDHVQGTAEFMSPEQATGAPADHRSDLYSLGALGFYVVTGRAPFEGASPSVVLAKHVTEPAPLVATVAPHAPTDVARTIDRLLRKDPERRFQDGAAVADALSRGAAADRALPVPLRVFIRHLREMARVTPGATAFLIFFGLPFFATLLFRFGLSGVSWIVTLGVVLPLTALGYVVARARKVIQAGHTIEDVILALRQDVLQRNEEFRFDVGERETAVDRGAKTVAIGGILMGGAALLTGSAAFASALLPVGAGLVSVGVGAAVLRASRARRRADIPGERWLKFFESRVGRWLFKLGGIGTETRDAIGAGTYRPTEMAISISAARLYDDLPKASKKGLEGLPETVSKLELDARTLRGQIEELDGALSEIGDEPAAPGADVRDRVRREVQSARDEAASRLRDVVAALETIRLGLLRMHAGERVLQSVTTELETAKGLSGDMSSLLEAHREVERLLAERRATGAFRIVEGD